MLGKTQKHTFPSGVEKQRKSYLYEKIRNNYEQNFVIPELIEKKKKLDNLRSFHRPVQREELSQHAYNYEAILKAKIEEKRMFREAKLSEYGIGTHKSSKLQTSIMKKTIQSERLHKMQQEQSMKEHMQKRSKVNSYSKIVKEMHWPSVSPHKQEEMEKLKKQVKDKKDNSPVVVYGKVKSTRDASVKDYLSTRKSKQRIINSTSYSPSEVGSEKELANMTSHKTKVNWKKFKNPLVPKPKLKRKGHIDDYLLKKRMKRQAEENDEFEGEPRKYQLSLNWQKVDPNDITDADQ